MDSHHHHHHHHHFAIIMVTLSLLACHARGNLLAEPVEPVTDSPNTVPALPLQADSSKPCHLDLSKELFGGVEEACGRTLDRSRCCPVLAAWLYAAHARSALQIRPDSDSEPGSDPDQPMMPESNSQKCVASLHDSLSKRNLTLPQPNSTCDTVLCFCGIRFHQIASLSCPAAFNLTAFKNVTASGNLTATYRNATPTANVRNLEKSCRNSSYAGCTKCLGALQKLKGDGKNGTKGGDSRVSKMFNKDCQLMGLTWLLARNKTAYIPTVSAVLRAIMYSTHPPHELKCSPDQENMPLAVDSLQFAKSNSSVSSPPSSISLSLLVTVLVVVNLIINHNYAQLR